MWRLAAAPAGRGSSAALRASLVLVRAYREIVLMHAERIAFSGCLVLMRADRGKLSGCLVLMRADRVAFSGCLVLMRAHMTKIGMPSSYES